MTVRNFKGLSALKEVECSASSLADEIDQVNALSLFKQQDDSILVFLNTYKSECKTFGEFSSCTLVEGDSKKSVVRSLVTDLNEEETTVIGCNVTALMGYGHAPKYSWSIPVYRESKDCNFCLYVCLFIYFLLIE
jgi:hypothetical protein